MRTAQSACPPRGGALYFFFAPKDGALLLQTAGSAASPAAGRPEPSSQNLFSRQPSPLYTLVPPGIYSEHHQHHKPSKEQKQQQQKGETWSHTLNCQGNVLLCEAFDARKPEHREAFRSRKIFVSGSQVRRTLLEELDASPIIQGDDFGLVFLL